MGSSSSSSFSPEEGKEEKKEEKKDEATLSSAPSSIPGGPPMPLATEEEKFRQHLEDALRTISDCASAFQVREEIKDSKNISENISKYLSKIALESERRAVKSEMAQRSKEIRTFSAVLNAWLIPEQGPSAIARMLELLQIKDVDENLNALKRAFENNPRELDSLREMLEGLNFEALKINNIIEFYQKEIKSMEVKSEGDSYKTQCLMALERALAAPNKVLVSLVGAKVSLGDKFNETYANLWRESLLNACDFTRTRGTATPEEKRRILRGKITTLEDQMNKLKNSLNSIYNRQSNVKAMRGTIDGLMTYLDSHPEFKMEQDTLMRERSELRNLGWGAYNQLIGEGYIGIHVPWKEDKVGFCDRLLEGLPLKVSGDVRILSPELKVSSKDLIDSCMDPNNPIYKAAAFIHLSRGFGDTPVCYIRLDAENWCRTPYMISTATKDQYEVFFKEFMEATIKKAPFEAKALSEVKESALKGGFFPSAPFQKQLDDYIACCKVWVKDPNDIGIKNRYDMLYKNLVEQGGVVHATPLSQLDSVSQPVSQALKISPVQWAYLHFKMAQSALTNTNPLFETIRRSMLLELQDSFKDILEGTMVAASSAAMGFDRYRKLE